MSHASFHAARLRPARYYGAEGDKGFAYVLTSDGEVYKQNEGLFTGNKEFFFEYDARTGAKGGQFGLDITGDEARVIEGKIIGSWDTFEQAKEYADRLIKSKGAAAAATPADPAKPADPFAPPPPPPAAGGMSTGMLVGIIGGGVALMGGLLYLASRSSSPAAK